MSKRLEGSVCVVTGTASGMGKASAVLFAAEGGIVACVDRNEAGNNETVAEITAAGGKAIGITCDLTSEEQVKSSVEKIVATLGPIKKLFNHAGGIVVKPFLETELSDWNWLMGVNVTSMFLMTKAVLPSMIASGGGAIVCTSSISAVYATPNEVLYDTTKGACHMFARAIAVEFRDKGVRCNTVCPGFVRTPHGNGEMAALQKLGVAASEADIIAQQGRLGEPIDIARAALFLLSNDADFITGTNLFVDGGFSAV